MRKAEAALSSSRKRVVCAVLAGLALGLLVSVVSLSRFRLAGAERSQLQRVQAVFDEQLAERDAALAAEAKRRSLVESEKERLKDTHYDLQQRVERLDKEKAELQAKLSAAASDAANLEKQRRAAQQSADAARLDAAQQAAEVARLTQQRDTVWRDMTAAMEGESGVGILGRRGGSAQSVGAALADGALSVRRPGGAGKGVSPTLAVLVEPGAPGRHLPLGASPEAEAKDPELAALLKKARPAPQDRVAVHGEVMVAISNANYAQPGGMLDTWAESVLRAGVRNALVVALDEATKAHAESKGLPAFQMTLEIPKSQEAVGGNHAVSGLKFRILRRFLVLGYAVLLSDVDIVTLRNPFPHLMRDCDVEAMSDGWDNATAYGYNDVADDAAMGWARYAHSMRVFVFNSGLFYIRPTPAALDLLDRIALRLAAENGWDQAIFNEVIFFPSRPGYMDPAVTRRVLDYMLFMNSKVLFKQVRHDPQYDDHVPVMVHVNYHPDKHPRMLAIVKRYVDGDAKALTPFPSGSE